MELDNFFDHYTDLLIAREETQAIRLFEENVRDIKIQELSNALVHVARIADYNCDAIEIDDIMTYATTLINGFTIR